MNVEEMQDQFFDPFWFDPDDRPKTALATRHLIERVPDDVFDELRVKVFAPPPLANGQSRRVGPSTEHYFIYLAPFIELKPQEEVDFVVAHEFAHAYLRHGSTTEGT